MLTHNCDAVNGMFGAPDRRFRVLTVSLEAFANGFFREARHETDDEGRQWICVPEFDGVPSDARIEAMAFDHLQNVVRLRVWSSEFEVANEAQMLPELVVTCTAKRYQIVSTEPKPRVLTHRAYFGMYRCGTLCGAGDGTTTDQGELVTCRACLEKMG